MQPSDLEVESQSTAILTYAYRDSQALEDVNNAFNYARTNGVIPIGICLKKPEIIKPEIKLIRGKLNLEVLKRLKSQVAIQTEPIYFYEMMRRNFRTNYRMVNNVSELPQILREVYLRTSFR